MTGELIKKLGPIEGSTVWRLNTMIAHLEATQLREEKRHFHSWQDVFEWADREMQDPSATGGVISGLIDTSRVRRSRWATLKLGP